MSNSAVDTDSLCMVSCACARCFRGLSRWLWSDTRHVRLQMWKAKSEIICSTGGDEWILWWEQSPALQSVKRAVGHDPSMFYLQRPWWQNWAALFCSCVQMDEGIFDMLPAECSQHVLLLWRGSSSPRKSFSRHLWSSKRFGVAELVAAVFSVIGCTKCAIMRLTAWNLGPSLIFRWKIVTCKTSVLCWMKAVVVKTLLSVTRQQLKQSISQSLKIRVLV